MTKLTDLPPKPPKVIIYGDVGAGKSALMLTLGHYLQVLDFEDGVRSGLNIKDQFTSMRHSVDVKQFLETDPTKKALSFKAFKDYVYGIPGEIASGKFPYRAVGVDSLTSLAESAINYILYNSGRLGGMPEYQHWGLAFTEIKLTLSVLRAAPIVVVLVAHEMIKPVGKSIDADHRLQVAVPGKNLSNEICRVFDEVWYLRARGVGAGKKQYIIQTVGTDVIPARSRANLPDFTDTNVGMVELLKRCGFDITTMKGGPDVQVTPDPSRSSVLSKNP